MPRNKYKVTLSAKERIELFKVTTRGQHKSQTVLNALILLNIDQGPHQDRSFTNQEIVEILPVSMRKIDRVKKRFCERNLAETLDRKKPNRKYRRKTDGDFEAHLIALSCSKAPEGYSRWSLRLLADQVVELNYVDSISYETVRSILKKRNKTLA